MTGVIGIGLQSEAQWLAKKEEDAAKVLAAGGWRIGDRVVSIIKHKPNNVKVGDVGTVVGPCTSTGARKDERVCVDFGKKEGEVNMLGETQIEPATAEGRREQAAAKAESKPKAAAPSAAASSVTTEPDAAKAEEKSGLAGGFRVGDRVVSLIKHAGVVRGDMGTVIGPCADTKASDPKDRVEVSFEAKTSLNMLVDSQIVSEVAWPKRQKEDAAKVFAATGWSIGDRVAILGRSNRAS